MCVWSIKIERTESGTEMSIGSRKWASNRHGCPRKQRRCLTRNRKCGNLQMTAASVTLSRSGERPLPPLTRGQFHFRNPECIAVFDGRQVLR